MKLAQLKRKYNALEKKFKKLKDLARIDLDLVYLTLNLEDYPEVKRELEKVQKLIQVLIGKVEKTAAAAKTKAQKSSARDNNEKASEDFQFDQSEEEAELNTSQDNEEDVKDIESTVNDDSIAFLPSITAEDIDDAFLDVDEIDLTPDKDIDYENLDVRSLLSQKNVEELDKIGKRNIIAIPKKLFYKNSKFWKERIENMLVAQHSTLGAVPGVDGFTIIGKDCVPNENTVTIKSSITTNGVVEIEVSQSVESFKEEINEAQQIPHIQTLKRKLVRVPALRKRDKFLLQAKWDADEPTSEPKMVKRNRFIVTTEEPNGTTEAPENEELIDSVMCEKCGAVVKKKALGKHLKTHAQGFPLQCSQCGAEYRTRRGYEMHLLSHSTQQSFMCDHCGKVFAKKSKLTSHKAQVHSEKRKKHCTVCGKFLSNAMNLRRHMRIHTGEKYECVVCFKKFTQIDNLKMHMRKHTGNYPHHCDICKKGFSHMYALKKHLDAHQNRDHESSDVGRRTHVWKTPLRKSVAPLDERYKYCCSVCERKFMQENTFCLHMLKHEHELVQCLLCHFTFLSFPDLKTHIFSTHLTEKPHKCTVCSETFYTHTSLYKHRAVHREKPAYSCSTCGKEFAYYSTLQSHKQATHNSAKYKCKICDKEFNHLTNRNRHQRSHSGEDRSSFKCMLCEKQFTTRAAVKTHLWTHRTEKRFYCDFCGEGFNEKRGLISHKQKLHQPQQTYIQWGPAL